MPNQSEPIPVGDYEGNRKRDNVCSHCSRDISLNPFQRCSHGGYCVSIAEHDRKLPQPTAAPSAEDSGKWTKGPWTVEQSGGATHLRSADGESLMCDEQYYPWVPSRRADWNLMAAAPTMAEYIRRKAEAGDDLEAGKIWRLANGNS